MLTKKTEEYLKFLGLMLMETKDIDGFMASARAVVYNEVRQQAIGEGWVVEPENQAPRVRRFVTHQDNAQTMFEEIGIAPKRIKSAGKRVTLKEVTVWRINNLPDMTEHLATWRHGYINHWFSLGLLARTGERGVWQEGPNLYKDPEEVKDEIDNLNPEKK